MLNNNEILLRNCLDQMSYFGNDFLLVWFYCFHLIIYNYVIKNFKTLFFSSFPYQRENAIETFK